MCKARDVAMAMIKQSIAIAKEEKDDKYLMDIVKLHKLMFLGQCYLLYCYGMTLFQETITAHTCGPQVEGINFVPATYGFGEIRDSKDEKGNEPLHFPLSLTRDETVTFILRKYGKYSADQIVSLSKESYAYRIYAGSYGSKPPIAYEAMKLTGQEIAEDRINVLQA